MPSPSELPPFPYHPSPDQTGAVEAVVGRTCACCGQPRGWAYVLGTYGSSDLRDQLCPWCIADGSAAERFDVRFTDLGSGAVPATVAREVVERIERRTPGFSGWQEERWLFHCDDGAAFLGAVGWEELAGHPTALTAIRDQVAGWGWEPVDVEAFVGSLDVDGASTAYLFRCRHCGTHLAYADFD